MTSVASRLQVLALMALGAFGLHEARYLLGDRGGLEWHLGHGHAYLGLLAPALAGVAIVAMALFVRRLALAGREAEHVPAAVSTIGVWIAASCGLLLVYVGQEWVEGLLAGGHGGALHGVFGHGGWVAVLLAHLVGALVALVLRGGRALVAALARRRRARAPRRAARVRRSGLPSLLAPRSLAGRHLAARGPPQLLSI